MCYNMHRCLWPPPSPSRAPSLARLLQHNPKLSQRNSYSGLSPQPLPCLCSSFVFPCWWELLMVGCIQRALRCVTRVVYILIQSQPWNAVWTGVWSLKIACILCWMPYSASLKGYSAAVWVSFLITPVFLTSRCLERGGLARQRAFPLAGGTVQTLSSFSSFSGESGAGKTESTKLILKFLSAMSQHSLELSCREKTSCVEQAILESRYLIFQYTGVISRRHKPCHWSKSLPCNYSCGCVYWTIKWILERGKFSIKQNYLAAVDSYMVYLSEAKRCRVLKLTIL